ncbi:PhzF family phenazine biosynthesis protein [Dipodascopsis tothii]|uniref:PhzF family phenazine biosynthesis protein n=1 Tax=Dipodascopsis tothii TaxID=44089 RepID=UPI0034CF1658
MPEETVVSFKQVDVFTTVRYKGNPVAVILHGDDLATEQMQQVANWTNLSETTFVVPTTTEKADYRVRIFTPKHELPFAGHPTIGTAHALLESRLITPKDGVIVQECDAGLVQLTVKESDDGNHIIEFELPSRGITPLSASQIDTLEECLGAPVLRQYEPATFDVGPLWLVAQLSDAETVLRLTPDFAKMASADFGSATGVTVFGRYGSGTADIEVRSFVPSIGVNEDPVCGSGNGAVAAFIRQTGQTEGFPEVIQSSQGACLQRSGYPTLTITADKLKVGGKAVTCVSGHICI